MTQKSVYLFQTLTVYPSYPIYPIYQDNCVNKGYHSGKKLTKIYMKHKKGTTRVILLNS